MFSIDFQAQLLSILSVNCDNEWDTSDIIMVLNMSRCQLCPAEGDDEAAASTQ